MYAWRCGRLSGSAATSCCRSSRSRRSAPSSRTLHYTFHRAPMECAGPERETGRDDTEIHPVVPRPRARRALRGALSASAAHRNDGAGHYWIVVSSNRDGHDRGYSVRMDGSRLSPLLPLTRMLVPGDISGDGRVVEYHDSYSLEGYVSRANGTGLHAVRELGVLSPDGKLLAFQRSYEKDKEQERNLDRRHERTRSSARLLRRPRRSRRLVARRQRARPGPGGERPTVRPRRSAAARQGTCDRTRKLSRKSHVVAKRALDCVHRPAAWKGRVAPDNAGRCE